jgi:predicted metal-dependent phosphoesterase TrpH
MASAAPVFDLQSHSTYSDGELAPKEVVAKAARAGVELLALTDHDSVDGVTEANRAAREHGIRLVPATEISALDDRGRDLHILGYNLDPQSEQLRKALQAFRADRAARADRMLEALRGLGFEIDEAALELRRQHKDSIGRPHLAQAVAGHPANAHRLEQEGLPTPSAILEAYLTPGAPAFSPRTRPTITEAIEVIHAAGGVAIWAHPFWDFDTPQEVLNAIDRFATQGIDGVEAFYATHTQQQTHLIARTCEQRNLLTTGSADFHGPNHSHFHTFRAFDLYGLQPNLGPIAA